MRARPMTTFIIAAATAVMGVLLVTPISGCWDMGPLLPTDSSEPPDPLPPHYAILVEVWPSLAGGSHWVAFGTIREGSYVDSLRVYDFVQDTLFPFPALAMKLRAGGGRPGTYHATVAAPGYVTWDTAGVLTTPSTLRGVHTVELYHELQESP